MASSLPVHICATLGLNVSPVPQANIHVTYGFAYFMVIEVVGRDDQLFPNN